MAEHTYHKKCYCTQCEETRQVAKRAAKQRYRQKGREREFARRRYHANSTKARAATQRWARNNAERIRNNNRVWAKNNPAKIAEYRARHSKAAQKRYRKTPKGKLARYRGWLAYHARKFNAPGICTAVQLQARWDFYGNRCYLCRAVATTTDHVIPLSRGGSAWPSNLRPACHSCNARKHTKSLLEYKASALLSCPAPVGHSAAQSA